jgi:hypothetical protein
MNFLLTEEKHIPKILSYFGKFHSGFIKSLNIRSHDFFMKDFGKVCSGIVDIDIDFGHNFYGKKAPYNQIIHASFKEVQKISVNIPKINLYNWDIYEVVITKTPADFLARMIFHEYDLENKM